MGDENDKDGDAIEQKLNSLEVWLAKRSAQVRRVGKIWLEKWRSQTLLVGGTSAILAIAAIGFSWPMKSDSGKMATEILALAITIIASILAAVIGLYFVYVSCKMLRIRLANLEKKEMSLANNKNSENESELVSFKVQLLEWRTALQWLGGILVLVTFTAICVYLFKQGDSGDIGHDVFALTVAIDLSIFGVLIAFYFFYVFRGRPATEEVLHDVTTYCYGFIAFSLLVSIVPFTILSHLPVATDIMQASPIAILQGCVQPADAENKVSVPAELRCGKSNMVQWVFNIGGHVKKAENVEPKVSGGQEGNSSDSGEKVPEADVKEALIN